MEENIVFERFLFGDGNKININDMGFCVDRIIMLPKIRPHELEKAVRISKEYCQIADFRRKLIEKSEECPVLIYRLYKQNVFLFEEIEPFLNRRDCFLLCYYFRKEISDFTNQIGNKLQNHGFDMSFFENESEIDQMIQYGFIFLSIEYCLKYDDDEELKGFEILDQEAKWSPFEWSFKPEFLDFISFAAFFGSIKCFRHLLMKGFEMNDQVLSMVVCSGCLDLYHLSQRQEFLVPEIICNASEFCHLSLLAFMIENGFNANEKTKAVRF